MLVFPFEWTSLKLCMYTTAPENVFFDDSFLSLTWWEIVIDWLELRNSIILKAFSHFKKKALLNSLAESWLPTETSFSVFVCLFIDLFCFAFWESHCVPRICYEIRLALISQIDLIFGRVLGLKGYTTSWQILLTSYPPQLQVDFVVVLFWQVLS